MHHAVRLADATENGWEMIFESLLRCRGNMVRTDKQADLAAAMGLRPVQNPQTPLGLPRSRLRRKTRKNAIKSGRILSALSKPAAHLGAGH